MQGLVDQQNETKSKITTQKLIKQIQIQLSINFHSYIEDNFKFKEGQLRNE